MQEIGPIRLNVMRCMYLLIAVGLGFTVWPGIVAPPRMIANPNSVVRALLGALAVVAALGVRYPLKMLPILLFELLWKVIWVLAFALPMWLHSELDDYASETLFACLMGVVLVPMAIPWRYVLVHYVRAAGEPWRAAR